MDAGQIVRHRPARRVRHEHGALEPFPALRAPLAGQGPVAPPRFATTPSVCRLFSMADGIGLGGVCIQRSRTGTLLLSVSLVFRSIIDPQCPSQGVAILT